jgi:hypothetical protein
MAKSRLGIVEPSPASEFCEAETAATILCIVLILIDVNRFNDVCLRNFDLKVFDVAEITVVHIAHEIHNKFSREMK